MKKKHQNGKRRKKRKSNKKRKASLPPGKASPKPDDGNTADRRQLDDGMVKRDRTQETETEKAGAETEEKGAEAADLQFDEEMVAHLQMQTSLIEEREVSREETIEMLKRVMRQHSMAAENRRDYVMRFLKEQDENPP